MRLRNIALLAAALVLETLAGKAQLQTADEMLVPPAYVAKFKDDKACAISYTFDDGLKEHYTLVTPFFNRLGFKGSFVINGSKINKDGNTITDSTRMTWFELEEMSKAGHEVSNHGWAHKNHGRFPLEEIAADIRLNDSAIFAHTGIMPRTFAYPNNTKTPEGMVLAAQNRVDTRTFQRSIGGKSNPDDLETWVNDLISKQDWGVGMTHGITFGYDHFANPQIFWQHLQQVKSREDSIWVGSFVDVAAYCKERDSTRLTIAKSKPGMTITPQLNLDKTLFTSVLTMIISNTGNIEVKQVRQKHKKLPLTRHPGKVLFDFDPYGGNIEVVFK